MRIWPQEVAAVCVTLACGCVPRAPERPPVAAALEVTVQGDTAWLTLHVTNVSGSPLVLRFASAQRFDFEVRTATGAAVWRWSADQVFAQVAGEERLEPGATRQWRASWPVMGRQGSYSAKGELLAEGRPLELSTGFEVGRE